MRIVCLSDTHEQHRYVKVPDGDLLIHSGDITFNGDWHVVRDFLEWFRSMPHKHKYFTPGNHDFCFEDSYKIPECLIDQGVEVDSFNLWASPMTPTFGNWAFMADRGDPIKTYWDKIPEGTDVLVTHGPPLGILDMTPRGEAVGCWDLNEAVKRVNPKVHIFGHIHHGYGTHQENGTMFINASICDERYNTTNQPVVYDLRPREGG